MIELEILPVCVIFFGLLLDVVGAVLIIRPILYFRGVWTGKNLDYFKKDFDDQTPEIIIGRIKMAWLGLGFLISGFAFQGLGNWYLNPPF